MLGLPIIFCKDRERTASEYSLMVYLVLLLSTVLMKVRDVTFDIREEQSLFGGPK